MLILQDDAVVIAGQLIVDIRVLLLL